MSLLLDALKKAAKDKEASSGEAADVPANSAGAADDAANFEFTLDDDSTATPIKPERDANVAADVALTVEAVPVHNTVSDEALQVLIHKTNQRYKRRRLIIWGSAAAICLCVLIISGLYFYKDIQQQVAALELSHRVSMQAVQSEPVKTTLSAMDSTSRPDSEASRAVVRKTPVREKPPVSTPRAVAVANTRAPAPRQQTADNKINVVVGEKTDPVGALLSTAWAAYNKSDYATANNLYAQVLEREKNNRDALMGMGAIALKNNEAQVALQYYNKMLQLDPRDPVANAAIQNMNNSSSADALSESKLLSLLRQDPGAAHLHSALGNKYAAQSKWPEAQAAYFSAFEHDSSSADYAYNLAVSLEHIGQPKQAAQYYSVALRLAHNSNISFSAEQVQQRLEKLQP